MPLDISTVEFHTYAAADLLNDMIFPMLKYGVKVVRSGRFRDVIVMQWSYTHRRGSSDPVLKALKF